MVSPIGRTIQLFLADGVPDGLIVASIHGWTGSVLVATQSTFAGLLARPEAERTGVYILFGPDPDDHLSMRAYIGEADSVRERADQSARERGFWETAVVVTTSDEALTKGHIRYLEARLIELTKAAGRVTLDNSQFPDAERRRLPEADRANMEAFLANLRVILPVVGLDLLKPRPRSLTHSTRTVAIIDGSEQVSTEVGGPASPPTFELRHRSSGVQAQAVEEAGEFIVLQGSRARKDTGSVAHSYRDLKDELVSKGVLIELPERSMYEFSINYAFRSPSAAAAVVLDRSANGRIEWHIAGTDRTYHQWQEERSRNLLDQI